MKQVFNDSSQAKAILADIGPVMVLAGPGSGKTFVITQRVLHLINHFHIKPNRILVITFTKSAALSMQERFCEISNLKYQDVSFATFHSVYFSFLNQYLYHNSVSIISNEEKINILDRIISVDKNNESVNDLSLKISQYKNIGYISDALELADDKEKERFIKFVDEYNNMLSSRKLIDFDDIILKCNEMLSANPNILDKIRNRYDAILIDEFQDINRLQYDILVNILGASNRNIFVVGDDDQSIYGFRGSEPKIMHEFLQQFKDTYIVRLSNNYRCNKSIVEASHKVILENTLRLKSEVQEAVDKSFCKDSFSVSCAGDKEEELALVLKMAKEALKNNESICILTRTNNDRIRYTQFLSSEFSSKDTYEKYESIKNGIIDDLYYYLHFTLFNDADSFIEIANRPERYININLITSNEVNLENLSRKNYGTHNGNELQKLFRMFLVLKKTTPYAFVKYIMDIMGYRKYLYDKKRSLRKNKIDEIINDIMNQAKEYSNQASYINHLSDLMKGRTNTLKKSVEINKKLHVLTFHGSKGLEFDNVIIVDVNEGIVPGRISVASDNVEEERRLFYVAMTRAKKRLKIIYIKEEDSMRMMPSRFLNVFNPK